MPILHLGQLQLEGRRREFAGMMIPPVGVGGKNRCGGLCCRFVVGSSRALVGRIGAVGCDRVFVAWTPLDQGVVISSIYGGGFYQLRLLTDMLPAFEPSRLQKYGAGLGREKPVKCGQIINFTLESV
jgi:hypothetical protein